MLAMLFINLVPFSAYAAENEQSIVFFEDGCYIKVEIIESIARASGSKTAKKQYTYYDDDNVSQWKVVLNGTFTYTGSSSTCTSSSVDVTIYNSDWYTISKSASKSNNKAVGSAKMGNRPDGVTIKTVPVNLTLSCDADGNLS